MENLNDVEFGSNQSTEEAPILIAQRYLNIFRQIHIFNKDLRTKFDDELLALAPNVTDFFKKLPGGRLLVEHIEEVKTERGISFVKTNREDFSDGLNDNAAPGTYAAPVPAQITGGSLVVDESFAETLAQSMANAFKDLPNSPVSSGGTAVSGDFERSFELIAEEIRASRTSLLDVLKETRNITDSVIASQVSISRILEGILSSRQHEENDTTNLNNRIIASQASITKLLEGLYTASMQKNSEISDYLNVDSKLQDFRDNMSQKINETLGVLTQKSNSEGISGNIESRLSAFKNEIKSDVNQSLSEIRQMLFNYMQNNPGAPVQKPVNTANIQPTYTDDDEYRKKKKNKKKKNHDSSEGAGLAGSTAFAGNTFTSVPKALASNDIDIALDGNDEISADSLDDFSDNSLSAQPIDGVIRNSEYKHEDDFSNIDLSVPPLDNEPEVSASDDSHEVAADINLPDNLDDLSSLDGLDFDVPEEEADAPENNFEDTPPAPAPKQQIDDFASLDNIVEDNDSFDIPNEQAADTQEETPSFDALDSFTGNMDEPFDAAAEEEKIPEQPQDNVLQDVPEQNDSFDDFSPADNTFEEEETEEPATSEKTEESDLDSFGSLHVGSLDDFAKTFPQDSSVADGTEDDVSDTISAGNEEENIAEEDNQDSDDDFSLAQPNESRGQSRYSAELDKIRQALTSDNVDISSLDEPIALDDYSDDENVSEEDEPAPQASSNDDQDWEYEYVEDDGTDNTDSTADTSTADAQGKSENEDWEWEYVDENGQAAPVPENKEDDGDWEWEYVEDDGNSSEEDNENNIQ